MYTLPQHGPFSSKHCSANNSHQIQIRWGTLYWANMRLIVLRYNFQTLSDCSGVQEHNAYKIMNALVTTVHGFQKEGKRKERKKKKKEKQGAYATSDTINGVMQNHNQEVCLPRTLTPLPLVPALRFTAYATSDTINAMQNHNQEIIFLPKTLTPLPGPHPHFTACLKGYYKFFSIALYSFHESSANELCCIMFRLGMWGGGQRGGGQSGGGQRQCTGQRKKERKKISSQKYV